MKFISKHILTGLITILPVALTIYLLYWLVMSMESMLGSWIQLLLPDSFYWPGMGLIAGLALAFAVGLLMHAYFVQRLFGMGEQLLYRMPIVKSVYRSIRDFFDYFSPKEVKEYQQVVEVSIGNSGIKAVGFITQENPENLPQELHNADGDTDFVLVYLPMSYMIGGYAVMVPRSATRPLNMNMEEAMRFILSAGVTGSVNASQGAGAAMKTPDQ